MSRILNPESEPQRGLGLQIPNTENKLQTVVRPQDVRPESELRKTVRNHSPGSERKPRKVIGPKVPGPQNGM